MLTPVACLGGMHEGNRSDETFALLSGPQGTRNDCEVPNVEAQVHDHSADPIGVRARKTSDELASNIYGSIDGHAILAQLRKQQISQISSATLSMMKASSTVLNQHIAILQACLPLTAPVIFIKNILADMIPVQRARKVWEWSIPWGASEDLNLIIGVLKHGFRNWDAIKADPELELTGKLFPVSKERVPNDIVLTRRTEYLLGLLDLASISPSAPTNRCLGSKSVPEALLRQPSPIRDVHCAPGQTRDPSAAYPSPPQSDVTSLSPDIEIISVRPSLIAAPPCPSGLHQPLHRLSPIVPSALVHKAMLQAESFPSLWAMISHRWTRAAGQARAASVIFINDVDEEELPHGMENFRYLESSIDE